MVLWRRDVLTINLHSIYQTWDCSELSKHLWVTRGCEIDFSVRWNMWRYTRLFYNASAKCDLFLWELYIIFTRRLVWLRDMNSWQTFWRVYFTKQFCLDFFANRTALILSLQLDYSFHNCLFILIILSEPHWSNREHCRLSVIS